MPAKGETLLKCPDCGKKGVSYRLTGSDDHWGCRYCDWNAFSYGHDKPDIINRRRLQAANPEDDIWIADPELLHLYLEDDDADQQ
jgi:hypothetical protein